MDADRMISQMQSIVSNPAYPKARRDAMAGELARLRAERARLQGELAQLQVAGQLGQLQKQIGQTPNAGAGRPAAPPAGSNPALEAMQREEEEARQRAEAEAAKNAATKTDPVAEARLHEAHVGTRSEFW